MTDRTYHGLDADEGTDRGANEGDEAVEDGDGGRDDVREKNASDDRREPDDPVLDGVSRKVLGTTQDSHEDVFGRELG